jgi:hypothetical protein
VYQHDEVVSDDHRPLGPQNPRSVGHVRRLADPGHGALQTHQSRLTEIQEDGVLDTLPQVHVDRNSPPGRVDARQRPGIVTARASFTREPGPSEPRSISLLGETSGRVGPSSEQGSEMSRLSYYTARSTPAGEAGSERRRGSSDMGTDISLPSYHTMPASTSASSRRRTYRTT